jgi:hypothetical protein
MAKKRSTVVAKWEDPWFMKLCPQSKLLWLYILDVCDHVGIYEYNEVLLRVQIGFTDKVDVKKHLGDLEGKIDWFVDGRKLWVKNFISVQYGDIGSDNEKLSSIHVTVLKELARYQDQKGLPLSLNLFLKSLKEKICRVQVGYTYPRKNNKQEIEKENKGGVGEKWNSQPGLECIDLPLPDLKTGAVIELFKFTKNTDITHSHVQSLWKVFKLQHFNGEKIYQNEQDVYSHFINWSKSQDMKNIQQMPVSVSFRPSDYLEQRRRADEKLKTLIG